MRTIGMLLGIPEEDQEALRDQHRRGPAPQPTAPCPNAAKDYAQPSQASAFEEYIDWRADHPSDDVMTELLRAEFEDVTGTKRTPHPRRRSSTSSTSSPRAGNETTTRLIGWTGKVLAEHPDQRQEIVEDRDLVPNAIEEVLRYEAPSPVQARYVTHDVEHHGEVVPAGSAILLLNGVGQPRRPQVPRRRPVRHPPQDRPPPVLRLRHPLLPRRRAGPAGGPGRARRGADPLPHVGGRLGQRGPGPHLDGARVGAPAGDDAMTAVLQGFRILEVAEHTFVPAASALCADWGAEVIKIEHVERGDAIRGLASTGVAEVPSDVHALLEHSNRGKRSLGLDLASPDGLDILHRLAATADVFLTNKLPRVRTKLRIDVEDIRAHNPRIVYVRGTGQGERGPDADNGSYDSLAFSAFDGPSLALNRL